MMHEIRIEMLVDDVCQQQQQQQQRSRHNSGTSMQSKRSDSVDSATAAVSGAAARLLGNGSLGELHSHQLRCEEPWHVELRTGFVMLYMQYLQQPGAGFQQIQVLPATSEASSSQRYTAVVLSCTTVSAPVI